MHPEQVQTDPPLRPNSSLGKTCWFWAPDLQGFQWVPFFKDNRLQQAAFHPREPGPGAGKPSADSVLIAQLGPPHRMKPKRTPWPWSPTRFQELVWRYPWGSVVSKIEGRDLTTEIVVVWKRRGRS